MNKDAWYQYFTECEAVTDRNAELVWSSLLYRLVSRSANRRKKKSWKTLTQDSGKRYKIRTNL